MAIRDVADAESRHDAIERLIVSVDGAGITADLDARLRVFGVSFTVDAFAIVNSDGLAFYADLKLTTGSSFVPFPNIKIFGSYLLKVNTTSMAVTVEGKSIGPNMGLISVNGGLNLFGFIAKGAFTISADSSGFKLDVPDDPGLTWDIKKSKMAKKESFDGEKSRRIDRILVRSSAWQPKSIRIIGDEPVVPGERDLFPSDHFGLVGVLAWDPEAAGRAKQEP